MTLLPDGTVLASGGSSRSDGVDLVEVGAAGRDLEPGHGDVDEVDSLQNGRQYHSTALLLPDGRVLMAGGGAVGGATDVEERRDLLAAVPLQGRRGPMITSAPTTMSYGASFDVNTPNAAQIAQVSLIRSPSVTHAFDMNQRFQFLNFTPGSGKVTVTAPANANLAPPGDYMLFLVDTNGVPSVASFIRQNPAPLSGDTTPPTVSLTAPADGCDRRRDACNVTANAADNDAVSGVQFKLDGADLGIEDTSAPYTVTLEHDDRAQRDAHAHRRRARPLRRTCDLRLRAGDGHRTPAHRRGSSPPTASTPAAGTAVADQSGNGNNGTLTNATWAGASAGRFGNALSFNGTNASVTIPDSRDARPHDRDDDRGLGATRRRSATTGGRWC